VKNNFDLDQVPVTRSRGGFAVDGPQCSFLDYKDFLLSLDLNANKVVIRFGVEEKLSNQDF
jgi:hypothetical protein